MHERISFFSTFIKNPAEVGSVTPSSKYLTNEIIKNIDFKKSITIVELGPGLGTFTKHILKNASQNVKLICLESNKKFCNYIAGNILDERLTVIHGKAEKLSSILENINIKKADCIISGLPILNFSAQKKSELLSEVKKCLRNKGKFILFQYTNNLSRMLGIHFAKIDKKFVPLNVPPCFVYVCRN